MKRVLIIPTLIVALAVAAMIALGFWQLQRLREKEALLAVYAHNEALPAIALPDFPDDRVLFRKASALCLEPVKWEAQSGRDANGRTGWRQIADDDGCVQLVVIDSCSDLMDLQPVACRLRLDELTDAERNRLVADLEDVEGLFGNLFRKADNVTMQIFTP